MTGTADREVHFTSIHIINETFIIVISKRARECYISNEIMILNFGFYYILMILILISSFRGSMPRAWNIAHWWIIHLLNNKCFWLYCVIKYHPEEYISLINKLARKRDFLILLFYNNSTVFAVSLKKFPFHQKRKKKKFCRTINFKKQVRELRSTQQRIEENLISRRTTERKYNTRFSKNVGSRLTKARNKRKMCVINAENITVYLSITFLPFERNTPKQPSTSSDFNETLLSSFSSIDRRFSPVSLPLFSGSSCPDRSPVSSRSRAEGEHYRARRQSPSPCTSAWKRDRGRRRWDFCSIRSRGGSRDRTSASRVDG